MDVAEIAEARPHDAPPGAPPFKLRYASHLGIRSIAHPLFLETLGTDDPIVHIDYAADQGFAGIEDNFLKSRPVEQQRRIGEALACHDLEMGCFVSSFDFSDPVWGTTGDDAEARIDAEIAGSVEAAKRVGGRYIVIAAGRDLRVPLRLQQAAMAGHLRRVGPMVEKAGAILCLEQTNEVRLPGMLLHHIADALAVVQAAASPAVKLLFDFHHVQVMDGNLLVNFERCLDEVAIVQVADVPARSEFGLGEVDWVNVLRRVRASGYGGLIEYEVFPSRPGAEGEQAALRALRGADRAL
jgi:hydroxypyruvate isomerase